MRSYLLTSLLFFISINLLLSQESPYKLLSEIKSDYPECFEVSENFNCQRACWEMSFIGIYKELLPVWDLDENYSGTKLLKEDSLKFLNFRPHSAAEFILCQAEHEQIIMINEAHHIALHRVFTQSLLEGLYQKGFRYLGFEGLSKKDTLINERKIPLQNKSGYYVNEPQFGNLIREAKRVGFYVFGYNASSGKNYLEREIGQANNIKAILETDPSAKIMIHAGWGHIREDSTELKLMAYQFQRLTGLNPFTINQITMSEHSAEEMEAPIYRSASKQIVKPSVYLSRDDSSVYKNHKYDCLVFHPRTNYINDRPDWLVNKQGFSPRSYSLKEVDSFPVIIKVFLEDDPVNAVPVDLVYIHDVVDEVSLVGPSNQCLKIVVESEGFKSVEIIE